MIHKFTKFNNDDRAFSGLEAAIVLIAFVVVAAAFSFAVLNAGFFATQEATGAIHTGIAQATSALQIGGDVVADASLVSNNITNISVPVMLAAGGRPIDLNRNRSIVSYTDVDHAITNLHDGTNVNVTWILRQDPTGAHDNILEFGELALIRVVTATPINLTTNEVFTINIQPPEGAALTVQRTIPSFLDNRTILR